MLYKKMCLPLSASYPLVEKSQITVLRVVCDVPNNGRRRRYAVYRGRRTHRIKIGHGSHTGIAQDTSQWLSVINLHIQLPGDIDRNVIAQNKVEPLCHRSRTGIVGISRQDQCAIQGIDRGDASTRIRGCRCGAARVDPLDKPGLGELFPRR